MDRIDIIIGICILIALVYYWSISKFNYWKSRNIIGPKPKPLLGNLSKLFFKKLSHGEIFKKIYDDYPDEKMIGIYLGREPALMLKDLDLITNVLITDFPIFPSRGSATFNNVDGPIFHNLFNLDANRWRPLRNKLSPTFSSGRIKKMFYLMLECGKNLDEQLIEITKKGETVIECRELMIKYTIDLISNCVFGLDVNTLSDSNHVFRKVTRKILLNDWKRILIYNMRDFVPRLFSLIEPYIIDWKMTDFFVNILRDTIDHRKTNGIVKHDFIDLITGIRDKADEFDDIEVTDNLLAAQLALFLLAGFETSANTMTYFLYELAQNHEIQDKIRDEINKQIEKNNGVLTYETINSMRYLQMAFDETLRKYPQGHAIARESAKEYTFPNTDLTIPAGMRVILPVLAIHRDPRIYQRPEVFDPERFSDEAIKSSKTRSWFGFGDGPRRCIAGHFARFQSKTGLITILQRYKVDICDKTEIPLTFDPVAFVLTPKNGVYLKISKIV